MLVAVQKQLADVIVKTPSHSCKNCKVLVGALASITGIYTDILEGVLKGEMRRDFVRRIASVTLDVVKGFTRG